MKLCPVCQYYLYLDMQPANIMQICRNCGHKEDIEKGSLILETIVQEKASEGYKVSLNEFTRQDPTLPHVKNIKCPNATCLSNEGSKERDVIYLNYDYTNLKYVYICNVCEYQWKGR